MCFASGANTIINRDEGDVKVGSAVIIGYGSPEGKDDQFLRVIQGDVSCWAVILKSIGDHGIIGFHETACVKFTGQFLSGAVDILFTARYGSELGKQSKAVQ